VKTCIYYQRQNGVIPELIIEWEVPHIPRVGESMACKVDGREKVYGVVTKIHYIVEDGKYFRHIIIANN